MSYKTYFRIEKLSKVISLAVLYCCIQTCCYRDPQLTQEGVKIHNLYLCSIVYAKNHMIVINHMNNHKIHNNNEMNQEIDFLTQQKDIIERHL